MSATFHPAPDPMRPYLKPRVVGGVFYCTKKPERSLGTKDLLEAQRKYDEVLGEEPTEVGNKRNKDAFPEWIKSKRKLEQGTVDLYESVWRLYCVEAIGGQFVQQTTVKDILAILNAASKKTSFKTGEPLSQNRLNHIYVCLSSYFTDQTKEPTRYRSDNPVAKIGNFRPDTSICGAVSEEEVLSPAEVEQLASVAAIVTHPNRLDEVLIAKQLELLIYILAYGGMRIGEALALEIDDLKETRGLHGEWFVWKKLAAKRDLDDPRSWFGKLKGKAGKVGDKVRYVPVMNAWLRSRVDGYVAEGLEAGWLKPGGLLFPTTEGKPRTVSGVDTRFKRVVKDAGMLAGAERKMDVVPHHLRHTFASWLLESGEYEIEGIALLIGDTVKVCGDRYTHLGDRTKSNQKAVRAMAIRHGEQVETSSPEPVAPAAVEVASNVIQFPRRVA